MNLSFVLVHPAVSENIGSTARAIKVMGYNDLRIVNGADHLNKHALMLAHGSHDILEQALTFNTLQEAISDHDVVIGTSAKSRNSIVKSIDISTLKTNIMQDFADSKIAIVFGCEESGLSNEDLQMCHLVSHIPLATTFPSLNLSQAVMLYAYELSSIKATNDTNIRNIVPEQNQLAAIDNKLKKVFTKLNIEHNVSLCGKIRQKVLHMNYDNIQLVHSVANKTLDL